MNNILKHIPGFRSGVKWKMIIAVIYYIICLIMFAASWGMGLFFLSGPFFIFSLIDIIQHKKKTLIPLILSFALMITGIAAPSSNSNTPKNNTNVATQTQKKVKTQSNEKKETDKKALEVAKKAENQKQQEEQAKKQQEDQKRQEVAKTSGPLKVHFIDVGQADSILIQQGSYSMLIDAGNNADSDTVVNYLKSQNVSKLDYVIGTHPHEDHIGGLDAVINSFEIGKIIMPKVRHTTDTYNDVINAISNKGLKITMPIPGTTYNLGSALFKILAPNSSSYEDLNNYSVVVKLTYGNTSFMLDGDAEDVSENEMLSKGYDLKADVLKVGHHGSYSSTTLQFLNAVTPKYAVISVGRNNDYGHPAQVTLNKFKAANIPVYRTDECGTIVAISDGKNISFNCKPGSYNGFKSGSDSNSSKSKSTVSNSSAKSSSNSSSTSVVVTPTKPSSTAKPTTSNSDRIVYWTPKGKSYHYTKDCPTLSRSKTILSGPLSQCPKSDPCDVCTQ